MKVLEYKWKVVLSIGCMVIGLVATVIWLPLLLNTKPASSKTNTNTNSNSNGGPTNPSVNLTVDYGNGTVRAWAYIDIPSSDYSVANLTSQECVVVFKYNGNYVSSIDGQTENSTQAWLYWVDGVQPGIGCGEYILQSGDAVLWNFTKLG